MINQIRKLFEDVELFNMVCSRLKINHFRYKLIESSMVEYSFSGNGYIWIVECIHNLNTDNIQDIFCATIMGDNHFNLELDFNNNRKKYYLPDYSYLDIKPYNVNDFLNQIYKTCELNIKVVEEYPNSVEIDKSYFKKYEDFKIFKLFDVDIPQEKSLNYFGFNDHTSFYCVVEKYWC
jgi:hypothetical protein